MSEIGSYRSVLVTGGTGSFGRRAIRRMLKEWPWVDRLVVYSRDELKQYEMRQSFSREESSRLRFFIGDVRDRDRLRRALEGVDVVLHAAALKQVDTAEYNPGECIKTNVNGALNLIEGCMEQGVHRVIALSTDKACAPINLYGATKLLSDKLFVSSNFSKGHRDIRFSVVRYGNVMGSRGSVIPFFMRLKGEGTDHVPVTDRRMTRFNITLDQGVDLVFWALERMLGGEIFVPKIPSYRITDVAEAVLPGVPIREIGIRPGEKLHEEMINRQDARNTIDLGAYYAILPDSHMGPTVQEYQQHYPGSAPVPEEFRYASDINAQWETVDSLRSKMAQYLTTGGQA